MKVTILPIVIGAFGTVTKGLLKELEDLEDGGWVKSIETTALLRIVPFLIGAFGTITKGLLKGVEYLEVGGRVVSTKTTALVRTARILRRVLET